MNRTWNRLLASLFAAVLATSATARGQAVDDEDEPDQPVQQLNGFVLNDATFGQLAFGVQDLGSVRARMDSYLTLKVEDVDRACALTAGQKQKLKLAGRGDIKRTWDRVEEKKRKYVNMTHDQNKLNEIAQDLQSLRVVLNGDPFVDGTFFSKALKSTLTDEQIARYDKSVMDKKAYRYRAKVDLVVATLDQTAGFTAKQREQLLDLILHETKPPKQFGPYDYQVVMIQLSKIAEDKLKPIFDDIQWAMLRRRFDQSRAMEAILIKNNVLPGPEDAAVLPAQPAPRADPPAVRRTFDGK
ncbi:MAG: hypothetical protein P4L84_27080 [Isosphaeraceae bacterium]|nr:hypothetical protein [Isosphaeraceae bacterium]